MKEDDVVEFRLLLRGHLPPDKRQTRDVKHRIRRELHPQLRTLIHAHPFLKTAWTDHLSGKPAFEHVADRYQKFGYRFMPLVQERVGLCSINFLLLRRSDPHRVFTGQGDLDNRIKTLIDALRMPTQESELDGLPPTESENPFFVLMEDDKLISEFSVTSDRLLTPVADDEGETARDVVVVIHVTIESAMFQASSLYDFGR